VTWSSNLVQEDFSKMVASSFEGKVLLWTTSQKVGGFGTNNGTFATLTPLQDDKQQQQGS
jgi:hypothetical protein